MAVNEVKLNGKTLIDLTGDSVSPESLLKGYSAHNRAGELIEGLAVIPKKVSELENDAGYATLESPVFTGEPKAPTPEQSANDLRIATTQFVKTVINALINGAPETLDTLKEIADALETNEDAIAALNAAIGNKVDKVSGKGLSTNDYTTTEKQKLAGIADHANNYSLPAASSSVRGGAKIGYSANGRNYPVQLSNEQMFVNVPWTDNDTTYDVVSKTQNGLVPKLPNETTTQKYLRQDGTWQVPPDNNTTYGDMKGATTNSAGTHGLVPAPAAGKQNSFLRGDGTWVAPATNLLGTVPGIPLDQTMGKQLEDEITKINSDLTPIQIGMDFIAGVEASAGTMVASTCVKWGKVIQFQFGIKLNRDVSAGGVISLGDFKYPTINTLLFLSETYALTMYGNGKANIKNIDSSPWKSSETKYFNGVYITA